MMPSALVTWSDCLFPPWAIFWSTNAVSRWSASWSLYPTSKKNMIRHCMASISCFCWWKSSITAGKTVLELAVLSFVWHQVHPTWRASAQSRAIRFRVSLKASSRFTKRWLIRASFIPSFQKRWKIIFDSVAKFCLGIFAMALRAFIHLWAVTLTCVSQIGLQRS